MTTPALRIRELNEKPFQEDRGYVLYWMTSFRRGRFNFALERAVELAQRFDRPLLIFEPLRIGYRWASDRLHVFVMQGMADNAEHFADKPVTYFPYVEPEADADKGLLQALAKDACAVVTDDWPCFFLPRMQASAARKLDVKLEAVDSNGLLPLRATERVFTTAFSFRAYLQKELPTHLRELPRADPLKGVRLKRLPKLPAAVKRYSSAKIERRSILSSAQELAIDHSIPPSTRHPGGAGEARARLLTFVRSRLKDYPERRNHPDDRGTSELSPFLHFGHLSAHEVFHEIAKAEGWSLDEVKRAGGKKAGFWGMSEAAEAYLDQLVTWRELAFNMASKREDFTDYDSLPAWSRATLEKHAKDKRRVYSLEQLEAAETHDEVWNAAQRQLVREGYFHNYLRMLWGKKLLEWSPTPREALVRMEQLMNKYSLDGRDPNSYAGYAWVLGRYDRPWGPERPIFGTVRYMSSENTARKLHVKQYLREFSTASAPRSRP